MQISPLIQSQSVRKFDTKLESELAFRRNVLCVHMIFCEIKFAKGKRKIADKFKYLRLFIFFFGVCVLYSLSAEVEMFDLMQSLGFQAIVFCTYV